MASCLNLNLAETDSTHTTRTKKGKLQKNVALTNIKWLQQERTEISPSEHSLKKRKKAFIAFRKVHSTQCQRTPKCTINLNFGNTVSMTCQIRQLHEYKKH